MGQHFQGFWAVLYPAGGRLPNKANIDPNRSRCALLGLNSPQLLNIDPTRHLQFGAYPPVVGAPFGAYDAEPLGPDSTSPLQAGVQVSAKAVSYLADLGVKTPRKGTI